MGGGQCDDMAAWFAAVSDALTEATNALKCAAAAACGLPTG
jgi:hypothetical protein